MSQGDGYYSDNEPSDDQLGPEDTLIDTGVADPLDTGYSVPEYPPAGYNTAFSEHESLDERAAEEEYDPYAHLGEITLDGDGDDDGEAESGSAWAEPGSDLSDADWSSEDDAQVGSRRAGRLVAGDEGAHEDRDDQVWASDVGIDGGAASAEEAAIHIIGEE